MVLHLSLFIAYSVVGHKSFFLFSINAFSKLRLNSNQNISDLQPPPPRKKTLLSFFLAFQSFFLMDIKLIRPAPEEICKMTIMAHYTNIRNNYCDHIAPYFCIYIYIFLLLFMPFYFLLKKQDVAMKNIIGHKTMNHIASSLIISSCFFEFRPTY